MQEDTTADRTATHGDPFAIVPDYVWILASGNALKVWCAIAMHADRVTQIAWPSWRRIASLTGLSRSTVARSVSELEGIGALVRKPNHRDDGGQSSNAYWLSYLTPPGVATDTGGVPAATRGVGSPVTPHELEPGELEPSEGQSLPGGPTNQQSREVTPDPKVIREPKPVKTLAQAQIDRLRAAQGAGKQYSGAGGTTPQRRQTRSERIAEADEETVRQLKAMGL